MIQATENKKTTSITNSSGSSRRTEIKRVSIFLKNNVKSSQKGNCDKVNYTEKDLTADLETQIAGASNAIKTRKLLTHLTDKNIDIVKVLNDYKGENGLIIDLDNEAFLGKKQIRKFIIEPLLKKAKEAGIDIKPFESLRKLSDMKEVSSIVNKLLKLFDKKEQKLSNEVKDIKSKANKLYRNIDNIEKEFSIENIMKKYPKDKYIIKIEKEEYPGDNVITDTIIKIINKKNNKIVKSFCISECNNTKSYNIDEYNNVEEVCKSEYFDAKGKMEEICFYNDVDSGIITSVYRFDNGEFCEFYQSTSDKDTNEESDVKTYVFYDDYFLVYGEYGDFEAYYYNGIKGIDESDETIDYCPNGEIASKRGSDGNLSSPLADRIVKNLKGGTLGFISASEKEDLEAHIMQITPFNVNNVLQSFKTSNGVYLETYIKGKKGLSNELKNKLISHIEECLVTYSMLYNTIYIKETTQIDNNHYKGDSYNSTIEDNIIYIVNNRTGKKTSINIEKLIKNLPPKQKMQMLEYLKKLPGEVLEDLSIETTSLESYISWKDTTGYYEGYKDRISLKEGSDDIETLVHELGHAIDYTKTWNSDNNENFIKCFNDEMKNYLQSNNLQYKQGKNKGKTHKTNEGYYNYCTMDKQEMFAECYTLLMLGTCECQECIEKYFPKTLEATKELLKEIRQKPQEERHKMS